MNALFTAFNIAGLSVNITTFLMVGVGILLLFTGYRFLKKSAYEMGFGPSISPWGEEIEGTGYAPLNNKFNYASYFKRQTSKSISRHNRKK